MKKSDFLRLLPFLILLLPISVQATELDRLAAPKLWLKQQNEKAQTLLREGQEFNKAVSIFKSALDFAISQDLSDQFPELTVGYGTALYRNGDIQRSYSVLIEILPKIKDSELKTKAKINQIIGMNLVFQDKFPEAYQYQMDAHQYYSEIGDSVGLMNVYYDIAANFNNQRQYKLALKNYNKGLEAAMSLKDSKMKILGITSIGGVWASLGNYEKALNYSGESIELAKELNDDEELGWASINRGHILGKIDRFIEAEFFLKEAYKISFKIENKLLTAYSLEQLSDIYIKQNKLEKAIASLNNSYGIYKEIGQTTSLKTVIKKHAEIAFKKKDFDNYKKYTDQYIALKDSIYSSEMLKEMASLKKGYEINRIERENQISLLKKDQELLDAKNYAAIAISSGSAIILILLLTLMYNRNKAQVEKNTILTEKNAEILRQIDILAASNQDLEKFAYIISHDLKEPLRNINGFTNLLSRKLKNVEIEEVRDYVNFITTGTQQMDELLSGLLEYSKLNSNKGKKENISTNSILANVIKSFKIQLEEKNCHIETADLPDINFSKTQLTQVFQNLIANSIKFSQEGGNKISIGVETKCEEYCFFVKDQGIGIDLEYQKNIFIVFQRLHDRGTYSGSGIGLATCKKIIEDHGGRIWVESEPKVGSCFYFTVPKKHNSGFLDQLQTEQNSSITSSSNVPELIS